MPTVGEALLGRLTRHDVDARLRAWSRAVLARAEIDVEVEDLAHVPARPVIFMSNHGSHLDVPVLYVACPGSLRMVAKAELFAVPIWGRAMREAGFIRVDRSGDREQARQAMAEAAAAIASGVSVWIAPEGTRSRDGRLGRMKRGGFRLARESGTPIVPVSIHGARELLPPGSRLLGDGGRVRVRFYEALAPDLPEDELVARVEARLRAATAGT